jgi:hypothetical protein
MNRGADASCDGSEKVADAISVLDCLRYSDLEKDTKVLRKVVKSIGRNLVWAGGGRPPENQGSVSVINTP